MKVAAFGVSSVALRAVVTTVAPPSSSRCTMAAPIPREPPVTTARLPENSEGLDAGVLNMQSTILILDRTSRSFGPDVQNGVISANGTTTEIRRARGCRRCKPAVQRNWLPRHLGGGSLPRHRAQQGQPLRRVRR